MSKITLRPSNLPKLVSDLGNLHKIVFEGAGVTGVVYTGAMKALEEQKLLDKVERFAGTSSGAICAAGAALGYRGESLVTIALNQNFRAFCRQKELINPRELKESLSRKGLFSGGEMRRWVNNLCARRIGQDALSFADLSEYRKQAEVGNREFFQERYRLAMEHKWHFRRHSRDPNFMYDFEKSTPDESVTTMMEIAKSFRALDIGATEIYKDEQGKTGERGMLFNETNTPNLTLSSAVRASAAYPYVFRQAKIMDDVGVNRTYTDGGFTLPLPAEEPSGAIKDTTLGFVSEFFPDKPQEVEMKPKLGGMTSRLKQLIAWSVGKNIVKNNKLSKQSALEAGFEQMNKDTARFYAMGNVRLANPKIMANVIPLDRDGVDGTDFEITVERKRELIDSAYVTMKRIIEIWRDDIENKNQLLGLRSSANQPVKRPWYKLCWPR